MFQSHEFFMRRAIELGKQAALIKKTGGAFGAVIVQDDRIIAEGYNQVIKENDPTWHGEMHAIREAGKRLGSPHLTGCVLYTSAEPCPMCLSAAYWAHLEHIYYAARIEDAAHYGNFQDVDIFKEVSKKSEDRVIKSTELLRDEAIIVWKEFAHMFDRAQY